MLKIPWNCSHAELAALLSQAHKHEIHKVFMSNTKTNSQKHF